MRSPNLTYEQLHRAHRWAYGEEPDSHLAEAVSRLTRGFAVDLGGGQGRHALYLASLGFDVELVDLSQEALAQATQAAAAVGLPLRTVRSNLAFYEPPAGLQAVVASLILHLPARHAALELAGRLGDALNEEGLLYLSVPGFDSTAVALAEDLLAAAGCVGEPVKHLVTRQERPRLPVSRRYETRAVGYRR